MKYKQLIDRMTLEEKASLCSGADFWHTKSIERLGIPNMMLTDGPHGLRKQTDKADHLGLNGSLPATCFPTASALACSWDPELLEEVGECIGKEAAGEDVSVVLGPGLNIKRDPLCGRNFEYFSEDPVLSGLCAGAEVRGVQRHPGADGCIKHFFANNQEDNRMSVNEHIDEQALRELYLRNFALAIETGSPASLMTSYNLVNGVHTANSYDAITAYAREEHGFSGFVMTDWSTSSAEITALVSRPDSYHRCASSPACIRAGNDLQMPGTQENVDDIIAAVEDGTLPVGCLQRCALRILAAVLRDPMFETIHCNTGGV